MESDKLKGIKLNKDGYGFIPKMVMQDENISIAAKAIYSYFCSFTGAGDCCFPTRKRICFDMGISNDSLGKYIKQLADNGYLIVEQVKENGRFSHNIYALPDTKLPCPKISDTEKTEYENLDTKNNNNKINNINKNNSIIKKEGKSGYAEILSSVNDDSLRDLYYEFIKMRKLIKSPMTDRALIMLIKKVNELETSIDGQKALLETAIINNWKSVYPLKQGNEKPQKDNSKYALDDMAAIERKKRLEKIRRGQGNE
jgi:hypothetical protein|nr:MAG TPA: helix-turn-helix domain protein [Caudoviricetes sp.]